jgi:hypothetical protein
MGIHQVGTELIPAGKAGAKSFDPFHLLTEAAKSDASTYGPETEHQRQLMLACGLYGCLGSRSRRGKLPPPVVQNRGEAQGDGDAVRMSDPLAEVEPSFDRLQSAVGEAKEPQGPCRIQPAKDTGVLSME